MIPTQLEIHGQLLWCFLLLFPLWFFWEHLENTKSGLLPSSVSLLLMINITRMYWDISTTVTASISYSLITVKFSLLSISPLSLLNPNLFYKLILVDLSIELKLLSFLLPSSPMLLVLPRCFIYQKCFRVCHHQSLPLLWLKILFPYIS